MHPCAILGLPPGAAALLLAQGRPNSVRCAVPADVRTSASLHAVSREASHLTSRVAAPRARKSFSRLKHVLDLPNLIDIQKASFQWFKEEGLRETIDDISPIEDYTGTLAVEFAEHKFGEPQFSIQECREKDLTYQAPLSMTVRFVNKETGEIREQTVFMGDFPMMTEWGTFIINGTERVIVTQLVRSPGAYLMEPKDATKQVFTANLMPSRGSWLELEIDKKGIVYARIDRKRKLPITTLLRALPAEDPEHGLAAGHEHRRGDPRPLRQLAVHRQHAREGHDHARGRGADRGLQEAAPGRAADGGQRPQPAQLALLRPQALRPDQGRPLQAQPAARRRRARGHARAHHEGHPRARQAGWSSCPKALGTPEDSKDYAADSIVLSRDPIRGELDEYEHFGNRRLRTVGELIQEAFRVGLYRMERVVRERMTTEDVDTITPQTIINIRPGRGRAEGVLRLLAAVAVHGPDELARRAHAPAPPVGARRRRPHARARADRGARRAPDALRPHVPDRDARGSEHRPDRLARIVRDRVRVRLHPDAVPGGQERQGDRRDHLPGRGRGGAVHDRAGVGAGRRQDRQVRARPGALPLARGRGGHRRAEGDPVHGRGAGADRVGRYRADPLPRAQRREPRADGREHAAAGGAADDPAGAARRHRRRVPRRDRLRRRGARGRRRARSPTSTPSASRSRRRTARTPTT